MVNKFMLWFCWFFIGWDLGFGLVDLAKGDYLQALFLGICLICMILAYRYIKKEVSDA